MKLNELFNIEGARTKPKRVGRGIASYGKTSCRGQKGQKARSGVSIRHFEGGQTPLIKRLPKRGFNCPSRTEYFVLTCDRVNALLETKVLKEGDTVDREFLYKQGIIKKHHKAVKLLGDAKINAKLNFELEAYSAKAKEAVSAAKGSVK